MLSYRDWLSLYGSESCDSCEFFRFSDSHCLYKSSQCRRYHLFRKDEKAKIPVTGDLFDQELSEGEPFYVYIAL